MVPWNVVNRFGNPALFRSDTYNRSTVTWIEIRQFVQRLADMPLIAARATQAHDSGVACGPSRQTCRSAIVAPASSTMTFDRGGMLRLCGVEQYTGQHPALRPHAQRAMMTAPRYRSPDRATTSRDSAPRAAPESLPQMSAHPPAQYVDRPRAGLYRHGRDDYDHDGRGRGR